MLNKKYALNNEQHLTTSFINIVGVHIRVVGIIRYISHKLSSNGSGISMNISTLVIGLHCKS